MYPDIMGVVLNSKILKIFKTITAKLTIIKRSEIKQKMKKSKKLVSKLLIIL